MEDEGLVHAQDHKCLERKQSYREQGETNPNYLDELYQHPLPGWRADGVPCTL